MFINSHKNWYEEKDLKLTLFMCEDDVVHYLIVMNFGNVLRQNKVEKDLANIQLIIIENYSNCWLIYVKKIF